MELNFNSTLEEYYKKFIDLQDKLKRSEEQRLQLEVRFNELVHMAKEEEQAHYKKLRSQYKKFLEEDQKRQERNEQIIRNLERVETKISMLSAKTERIDLLRKQYQNYLIRMSINEGEEKLETPKLTRAATWIRKDTIPRKSVQINNAILNRNSTQTFCNTDRLLSEIPKLPEHNLSTSIISDSFKSQYELLDNKFPDRFQRNNNEKIEFLDRFLENLESERHQKIMNQEKDIQNKLSILNRLENDMSSMPSNQAAAIADEILSSIYARYYNKNHNELTQNEKKTEETLDQIVKQNEDLNEDLFKKKRSESLKIYKGDKKPTEDKNFDLIGEPSIEISVETFNYEDTNIQEADTDVVNEQAILELEEKNNVVLNSHNTILNESEEKNTNQEPEKLTRNKDQENSPSHFENKVDDKDSTNCENDNNLVNISEENPVETKSLFGNRVEDDNQNIGEFAGTQHEMNKDEPLEELTDTNEVLSPLSETNEKIEKKENKESNSKSEIPGQNNDIPEELVLEENKIENKTKITEYKEEKQVKTHEEIEVQDESKENLSASNKIAFDYPDQMLTATNNDNNKTGYEINQQQQLNEENNFDQSQYEQQYIDTSNYDVNNPDEYNQYGQYTEQIFYNQNGEICEPTYDENGQIIPQYDENGQIIVLYDQSGQQYFGDQLQYDQMMQQQYDENGQPIYSTQEEFNYSEENQYQEQQQIDDNQHYNMEKAAETIVDLPKKETEQSEGSVQEPKQNIKQDKEVVEVEVGKAENILDMLDTDTENSTKENTSKLVSNDSDFDFS